ncbi:uncharacterized protein LOC142350369 [Convolutriloba macropyga]|uniref:uncharacterized protein LOC142350369 n=1 Tax=Convolutriloba macropyga TaxID=536237 RepID=UPI003F523634
MSLGKFESMAFQLAGYHGEEAIHCLQNSKFYCLLGWFTTENRTRTPLENDRALIWYLAFKQFKKLNWFNINPLIVKYKAACCMYQSEQYYATGRKSGYSPHEYMERLSDFRDEGKHLNSITVRFNETQCVNIIERLTYGTQVPDVLVVGVDDSLVNLEIPVMVVPPESYSIEIFDIRTSRRQMAETLTFRWFKGYYICKDHPEFC